MHRTRCPIEALLATDHLPGVPETRGTTVQELGVGYFRYTVLTFDQMAATITNDSGVVQYSGTKIYTFPKGHICTFGAIISGKFTAKAPIKDAFTCKVALGTAAATTGATLLTTHQDIIQPSGDFTAASKVATVKMGPGAVTALTESGARWFDGTTTAKSVHLNVKIAHDAAHNANTTGDFTGKIIIPWLFLGNY